jgi:acyl carrier protein
MMTARKSMTREDIIREINKIFIDILDNDGIVLDPETTANDVEGWDSLTHVQIMVAIENRFKIRFKSAEIQSFDNVGELADAIIGKLPA